MSRALDVQGTPGDAISDMLSQALIVADFTRREYDHLRRWNRFQCAFNFGAVAAQNSIVQLAVPATANFAAVVTRLFLLNITGVASLQGLQVASGLIGVGALNPDNLDTRQGETAGLFGIPGAQIGVGSQAGFASTNRMQLNNGFGYEYLRPEQPLVLKPGRLLWAGPVAVNQAVTGIIEWVEMPLTGQEAK